MLFVFFGSHWRISVAVSRTYFPRQVFSSLGMEVQLMFLTVFLKKNIQLGRFFGFSRGLLKTCAYVAGKAC